MTSAPMFPGMNPYLESSYHWPEIHTWLIVEIARALNPHLRPKYRAAVETRVYMDSVLVGNADASIYSRPELTASNAAAVAISVKPERVTLPMTHEITEISRD